MVGEEADEVQLHALPQRVGADAIEAGRAELALDPLDGLRGAAVVEVDPVARDVADREPVGGLEIAPGRARALAKQRVVAVEPFEQDAGDGAGAGPRRAAPAGRARGREWPSGRGVSSVGALGGADASAAGLLVASFSFSIWSLKYLTAALYSSMAAFEALLYGSAAARWSLMNFLRQSLYVA